MNLNEKIKYYRNKLNFTQQELAIKAGISLRALSNYEKGLRTPSMQTLLKIAKALDIPVKVIQPQLIKSPEIKYLFAGSEKLNLENEDLEDQRGNDFRRVADLFEDFDYQINEINDNDIDKIEISTIEEGTIMILEENDFINLGNQLVDEIEDSIRLQIKQFIHRNQ